MARGKGKGKGGGPLAGMPEIIKRGVRGAGKLAYGDELHQVRQDIKGAKAHRKVVDRAYDAYAKQLAQIQAAQQQAVGDTQASILGAQNALAGIGAQQTALGTQQANQRAALLGQGGSVGESIQALGGNAGLSRGEAAMAQLSGVANVGLANYTDLSRRAATGERDRIRAKDDVWDRVQELRDSRRQIKGEKGAYMAEKLLDVMQQEKENQIAMMGLRLDKKEFRHDKEMDWLDYQLEAEDVRADNRRADKDSRSDRRDTRHDNRNDGSGGGTDTSGMSPSEREYWREKQQDVKAAWSTIDKVMRNQGIDLAAAAEKARVKGGFERWVIALAKDLAKGGGLKPTSKKVWKSKSDGPVPGAWS